LDGERMPATGIPDYNGIYTLVVPTWDKTFIGDGYGLLSIASSAITLNGGTLADGQNFKQSKVSVGVNGRWPLFSSGDVASGVYGSLIMGWVNVSTNLSTNNLVWIKKAGVKTYQTSPFSHEVELVSDKYGGQPLPALTNSIVLEGAGISGVVSNSVTSALVTDAKKVKLKLDTVTGKLSLTMIDAAYKGTGVGVLQPTLNEGRGYYLLKTDLTKSGLFLLEGN
jgi:hypothetical protein